MGAGMSSRTLGLAVRLVRLWTRVYTLGMSARVRDARLSEIDCDLWEYQHDADRPVSPIEIFVRLLLGIPDDLLWRLEHAAAANTHDVAPVRRTDDRLGIYVLIHATSDGTRGRGVVGIVAGRPYSAASVGVTRSRH